MLSRTAMVALLLLTGCASPPAERARPKPDPTKEAAYADSVARLGALNRKAEELLKSGRSDEAAAAITEGQPLQARVLAAPNPTLEALEAASDLDDLYARMLLSNHNDGWARMLFQKNLARWKAWKPATAESARRLRRAQDGIAECDRRLARQ
jgi:hypothetical protein